MSEQAYNDSILEGNIDVAPASTGLVLRPYQNNAVAFHTAAHRSMNTFQPGLGKTEVAIALGCDADLNKPTHTNLIVCPSFLMDMWFDRILKYRPKDRIVMASGTRKARQRALAINADWYIVNYEMLHARPPRKERVHKATGLPIKTLEQFKFNSSIDNVTFDEAHHLKSKDSKHAQAAYDLVHPNHIQVLMLTGTPIKREADDLYMPCHIMYPKVFRHQDGSPIFSYHGQYPYMGFDSYHEFVKDYCWNLPSPYGDSIFSAKRTPLQELMDRIAFYTSYEDAGIYRPEVEPSIIRVTMDPNHKTAYDAIASGSAYQDITFNSAMSVMHALRTVTCCPAKIKATCNTAESFDSALIFVEYLHSAKLLKEELDRRNEENLNQATGYGLLGRRAKPPKPHKTTRIITGEISKEERWNIIREQPDYIICTLRTGSEGIDDLTYIKSVIFFEETYTPLEIEQGIDRVRRAGNSTSKVNVYFIHAKNTIDEIVHAAQTKRGITAEYIVRKALERYKKLMRQDPDKYIQVANV